MTTIRLGISTCPNDTFAFHALMERLVDWQGLDFRIQLLDIQDLNDRLFAGDFDVAKASFHAALLLADGWIVLPSGSALGFGVGPLLLASAPHTIPQNLQQVTLCPGRHTTASLLFQLFYPGTTTLQHVVFSDIMPQLQNRSADFGVCIHEGRFTWQQQGLFLVEDLGTRWETVTGCPLPLGGILAGRHLSPEIQKRVQSVIHDSLQYAIRNRSAALPTMRRYAQEFDDTVLMQHVDLYVNDWTLQLGDLGQTARQVLSARALQCGLVSLDSPPLEVLEM
ncbi:MAG: 1,4-dihydroxy-6-naphthoate synthase [Planctomycetaceae bacterium]